jgi:SAM-dependent methyltransferase
LAVELGPPNRLPLSPSIGHAADQVSIDTVGGAVADPEFDADGLFDEDYLYFYAHRTDSAHNDAETELIWRLLRLEPDMAVLDLACGHGRIANRLAERGCEVTGLDSATLFLERAREDARTRGVAVEYVWGDMRELPWYDRFDVVISWFTAFGYFDDPDNRRVLAEVYQALRPGGRLVLDLNNYTSLLRDYQPCHATELDGNLLVDRRRLDPLTGRNIAERTVVRNGRVRRIPYFVRLFTFPELRDWLLDAGFSGVTGYGDDGGPLTVESSRMIVVAHR